ncbi:MAG: hypothetical protein FJ090_20415 [Deltaproteobacteria bacterium]|nr:hypothetical protein [Deltaproteobacteria bacterium]
MPEAEPAADDGDDDTRLGIARWEEAAGITGDPRRMHEKGPGKWTLQGRSMEELAEQLPPGESRVLDLGDRPAGGVPWWVVAAGAVAAAIGSWMAFT